MTANPDKPSDWYMLVHPPGKFRWVGPVQDGNDWEQQLVTVRKAAVENWTAVPIEWLPETIKRPACDFPIFWSSILCMSKKASAVLEPYLRNAGEFLELRGLNDNYIGFHCLQTLDVMCKVETEQALAASPGVALASPKFVPTLRRQDIGTCDVFRISQSFQKIFVSNHFKDACEQAALSGLHFPSVPLI
jgi:hypothetical protein